MFKVIIIGGDSFNNYEKFKEKCIYYLRKKAKDGFSILTIKDKTVEKFSKEFKIDIEYFLADWNKNGTKALLERNNELLKHASALIAFDNGKDKDVYYICTEAKKRNIPVRIVKK